MSENVLEVPSWVRETQRTLGSIVQRPRLTEKLLLKPPFRFIHDILMETIRVTGYTGLNIEHPVDYSSSFSVRFITHKTQLCIQDRESKVAFLERVITGISCALGGRQLDVNPSKIGMR